MLSCKTKVRLCVYTNHYQVKSNLDTCFSHLCEPSEKHQVVIVPDQRMLVFILSLFLSRTHSHTIVPSKSSKQVLWEALTVQLSASLGVNVKCLEQVEVKSEQQKL